MSGALRPPDRHNVEGEGGQLRVVDFGRAEFATISALQESLAARVPFEEVVLIGEHPSTMSYGRRAAPPTAEDRAMLASHDIAIAACDRGGAITWHGPGQIVLYPIVRLTVGVLRHVEQLAHAAAQLAQALGITATFDRAQPGLYVQGRKLASIGVRIRRRIALHGLALNVQNDLRPFALVPICGESKRAMTSLVAEGATLPDTDRDTDTADLRRQLATLYCATLGRTRLESTLD